MKYVLVTGADHGVGLELAKQLISRNYYVLACRIDVNERQIDELKNANKDKMEIINLDISSDISVKTMKEEVNKITEKLDLIINNAGILGDINRTIGDQLDYDEMLKVINVNAIGTLRVTNELYDLISNGEDKTIVNISSEAGSIADSYREGWFGYCMSKAANNMQSTIVHNNLKKIGGRVVAIHPGHVATYMRGHLDTTAKITPKESAEGILRVVLDNERVVEEKPVYMDYSGKRLPW